MALPSAVVLGALPSALAILAGVGVAVLAVAKVGLSTVLVSVVIFGLPFVASCAKLAGLSPTEAVMALDVFLAILVVKNYQSFLSRRRTGIGYFLLWWFLFLFSYSFYLIIGPQSAYSYFSWSYLFVYGNYYAMAGLLAVKDKISLSDVFPLGVVWFGFQYAIMGVSVFGISDIADTRAGLRIAEGFDAIGSARGAGLLMLAAIQLFLFSRNRMLLPQIIFCFIITAPLVWYSYTRQVYVALAFVVVAMMLYRVISRDKTEKGGSKYFFLVIGVAAIVLGGLVIQDLLISNPDSRLSTDGMEFNRLSLWVAGLDLIMSDPIFGYGVGGFQKFGIGLWPHNWFLEAWVELGIMGLFLTVIGGAVFVSSLFRAGYSWLVGWCFLGLYYLIVVQVSGDISRNSMIFFFLAIAFSLVKKATKSGRSIA